MANKDNSKSVSEYNIKEFMDYLKDQYNFSISLKMINNYISFLEGFCVSFPAPEKFEQIINVLKEFRCLIEVSERYSK